MTIDGAMRYDRATIALHWATAVIVLVQWASASLISLVAARALRMIYWDVHFALGLSLFAVVAARLWWRRTGGRKLPRSGDGVGDAAARAVHALLYAMMLWLVALGVTIIALRGWPLAGLFTIPPIAPGYRPLSSTLIEVHQWSAHALMVVALGHAAVALFHHTVLKDGTLLRMASGRQR